MGVTSILSFITDNWKAIVIGIVIIAALVYVEGLRIDVAHKETEIVSLKQANSILVANNTALQTSLDTQNGAIEKISNLAEATQNGFKQLGVNITQQSVTLDARLQTILKDKKPVTCDDTIKYLIDAKKGYQQ